LRINQQWLTNDMIHDVFSDCAVYGLCPARDEFYLVVCEICGVLVKPQALQQHTGIILLHIKNCSQFI